MIAALQEAVAPHEAQADHHLIADNGRIDGLGQGRAARLGRRQHRRDHRGAWAGERIAVLVVHLQGLGHGSVEQGRQFRAGASLQAVETGAVGPAPFLGQLDGGLAAVLARIGPGDANPDGVDDVPTCGFAHIGGHVLGRKRSGELRETLSKCHLSGPSAERRRTGARAPARFPDCRAAPRSWRCPGR